MPILKKRNEVNWKLFLRELNKKHESGISAVTFKENPGKIQTRIIKVEYIRVNNDLIKVNIHGDRIKIRTTIYCKVESTVQRLKINSDEFSEFYRRIKKNIEPVFLMN